MPFVVSWRDNNRTVATIVPDPADALPFAGRPGFEVCPVGPPMPDHELRALAQWQEKQDRARVRADAAERAASWAKMTDGQRRAWGLAVVPDDCTTIVDDDQPTG